MSAPFSFDLFTEQKTWLVTGAAGFIGSNLSQALIANNQKVIGLDNLSTGKKHNIRDLVEVAQGLGRSAAFEFVEGDINDKALCMTALKDVDLVLHQAALGSVPRSISNPLASHHANVNGFLNILQCSVESNIKRLVYASSSSVYGDHPDLPKVESTIGRPLSPYAATKLIDEILADVFQKCYGIECVGLRYFNVFGPRQDPNGPYAAVIPKWISAMLSKKKVQINGDGQTSRDFCHIDNVLQANFKAAIRTQPFPNGSVYNVAFGQKTSLIELAHAIARGLKELAPNEPIEADPEFMAFRQGDVRHSLADISAAVKDLDYRPTESLASGLRKTCEWYWNNPERL
jgi:UDP-N-acetylglucosamine/UDP-N-acetylgalactosamine 4-epimerase